MGLVQQMKGKAKSNSPEHCAKRLFEQHSDAAASATCSLSQEDFEDAKTGMQARDQLRIDLRDANIAIIQSSAKADLDCINLVRPNSKTLWRVLQAYIELCPETTQAAASMSVEKQAVDEEGAHITPSAALVSPSPDKRKQSDPSKKPSTTTGQTQGSAANEAKRAKRSTLPPKIPVNVILVVELN